MIYRIGIVLFCALGMPAWADSWYSPVAKIGFAPISEASGMVKSRRYEDVIWVHNDSGDVPRLFAIDSKGKVIFPGFMAVYGEVPEEGKTQYQGVSISTAAHYDWEDIAADDDYLYVADMGNNGNSRRDLGIYVIPEPNPRAVAATRTLVHLPVKYPDQASFPARQWHFDSESLFVYRDKLYVITKHRQDGKIADLEAGGVLYRLDTRYADRINTLTRIGFRPDFAAPTAAELSPDGQYLAVLCHLQLWVFTTPDDGDNFFESSARKVSFTLEEMGQVESLTWLSNNTLLFGSEQGNLYKVAVEDIPKLP